MEFSISVIMPVYNDEEYLSDTLQSLLEQSVRDYELIAVDDGSTDQSMAVLKEYEPRFLHMRILSSAHGGPAAARNLGIKAACGRYLYFLDADDLLAKGALFSMLRRVMQQKADVLIAGYETFDEIRSTRVHNLDQILSMDQIPWNRSEILLTFSCWNKLFRRDFVLAHGIRFPALSYSEDGVFTMRCITQAKKITGLPHVAVRYRRSVKVRYAITSGADEKRLSDYLCAHRQIRKILEQKFLSDHPGYTDFAALLADNAAVFSYMQSFYEKETQILLDQFYRKFWQTDPKTISLIREAVIDLLPRTGEEGARRLAEKHRDLPLSSLFVTQEEAMRQAEITVILCDDAAFFGQVPKETVDRIIRTVLSLQTQTFVPFGFLLPLSLREAVRCAFGENSRFAFADGNGPDAFLRNALQQVKSPYVLLADPDLIYEKSAFRRWFDILETSSSAYVRSAVYPLHFGRRFPDGLGGAMRRVLIGWRKIFPGRGRSTMGGMLMRTAYIKDVCPVEPFTQKELLHASVRSGAGCRSESWVLLRG